MRRQLSRARRFWGALLVGLSVAASARADGSGTVPTQYRGYTEINRLLKERVARSNGFELGTYLGETSSEPSSSGLLSLLGTYQGSDTDAQFRNGDPNSINMILWYIAFNGLAKDIAALCPPAPLPTTQGRLSPLPELMAALTPLCAWPQDTAKTDTVLYNYWTALMSFDAPPEEFEAWKTYFLTDPEFAQAPAAHAVAALTLAALYNPYFLLRN